MQKKAKRVTIKDVADYCGLSKSLVAYIINNSDYRTSTPENRKKVEEAVKALNYRPNQAAKELSSGKFHTIGIAMPMSGTGFYGDIAVELQRKIKERGYASLFSFWGGDDPAEAHGQAIRNLLTRNIDGVISWDASPKFREAGIPAVVYGAGSALYDSIAPDDEFLIKAALKHLAEFGHGTAGILSMGNRNRLFGQYAAEFGLQTRPEWIYELVSWNRYPLDAFEAFHKQCGGRLPDALICHSASEAVAAISAAQKLKIRVPEDISVIACDDSLISKFFHPGIDAFDIRLEEIATAMVDRLLERMKKPEVPVENIRIIPKLIHRESVIKQKQGDRLYDAQ